MCIVQQGFCKKDRLRLALAMFRPCSVWCSSRQQQVVQRILVYTHQPDPGMRVLGFLMQHRPCIRAPSHVNNKNDNSSWIDLGTVLMSITSSHGEGLGALQIVQGMHGRRLHVTCQHGADSA